jgi:uncharacterized membrane protein
MAFLQQRTMISGLPAACALPPRRAFVCRAQKPEAEKEPKMVKLGGLAAAGLAASILLTASAFPEEAMAARSGGRTGGSSFRSAPRSAPSGGTTINRSYNYNVSPAPPVYGGFGGFGGYGYGYGGGISLFPTFVTPVGGGLFQILFLMIAASTIVGIARSVFSRKRDNDNWDD